MEYTEIIIIFCLFRNVLVFLYITIKYLLLVLVIT